MIAIVYLFLKQEQNRFVQRIMENSIAAVSA